MSKNRTQILSFYQPSQNVERMVHILKEKCRYALLANITNETMLPK